MPEGKTPPTYNERLTAFQPEADRIADAIAEGYKTGTLGAGTPHRAASDEYARLWDRARLGQILWPERVRAITPILLEIVADIDANERAAEEIERRSAAAIKGWRRRKARTKGR